MLRLICATTLTILCAVRVSADSTPATEIWLASTRKCNTCSIYADVAARRHYGRVLHYTHGEQSLDIPIKRVDKRKLPQRIVDQIDAEAGPRNPYWPVQLTVLVVRGDKVLSSGSIADSADIAQARYSKDQMFPPAHPRGDHPSIKDTDDVYERFFREHWNLEYFVAAALGHRSARPPGGSVDLSAPNPVPLGNTNVILWGAAETPLANAQFIAHRLQQIRPVLQSVIPASEGLKFLTLYGHGPGSRENDTSVLVDGAIGFIRADVPSDLPADASAISSVLTAIKNSRGTRNLMVHVGHSGEAGAPLWGQPGVLAPEELAEAGVSKDHELIMISGGCHSGIFARSVRCGFFAAHPEVVASGCQLSRQAIEQSDDYLRLFFESFKANESRLADRNGDGEVSFSEAHWHASTRIEDHQLSYTTIDAMADAYFDEHPGSLPRQLTVAGIQALGSHGTPEERAALEQLTNGHSPGMRISLNDLVTRNHRALARLNSAREMSSAKRNAILALSYKLMLPMLARRLVYKSAVAGSNALDPVAACEAGTLSDFRAE